MDGRLIQTARRWTPSALVIGLLVTAIVVAFVVGTLAPQPHGHWTDHLAGAVLAAAMLVVVLVGAALAWHRLGQRPVTLLATAALATVIIGLITQAVGDMRVSHVIWQTPYGDDSVEAYASGLTGYDSGHTITGIGDLLVYRHRRSARAGGRFGICYCSWGERDPKVLAQLARTRLRAKLGPLAEAFTGFFTDQHAFLLAKMLGRVDALDADLAELDTKLAELIAPFTRAVDRLDEIPGIGQLAAQLLIAELGVDMTRFPTAGHLVSWAKFAPGVKESAGKRKGRGSTGHGNPYLAWVLGEAAVAASKTDTFLVHAIGGSPVDAASNAPSSRSAVPSWSLSGTCCPTRPYGSTIWALASTTPALVLNAPSATTSASSRPSATESSSNPPPDRPSPDHPVHPDRIRALPGHCQRACSPWISDQDKVGSKAGSARPASGGPNPAVLGRPPDAKAYRSRPGLTPTTDEIEHHTTANARQVRMASPPLVDCWGCRTFALDPLLANHSGQAVR